MTPQSPKTRTTPALPPSDGAVRLIVESSAVLAWLLGEPRGADVARTLASAACVVTSRLTLLECERALVRAERLGVIDASDASVARGVLAAAAVHWTVIDVTEPVFARARGPFPREPVRTLDAIHLATAQVVRSVEPIGVVLSLDERVRVNAATLGFELLPARSD